MVEKESNGENCSSGRNIMFSSLDLLLFFSIYGVSKRGQAPPIASSILYRGSDKETNEHLRQTRNYPLESIGWRDYPSLQALIEVDTLMSGDL